MPYKLASPTVKAVQLLALDATGETTATFRQATMEQVEMLQGEFADREYQWPDETITPGKPRMVTQKTKWNPEKIRRVQVWLTMVDCNIQAEDGAILFPFKAGRIGQPVFDRIWGKLPSEVAEALVTACHEVNPNWGTGNTEGEEQGSTPISQGSETPVSPG